MLPPGLGFKELMTSSCFLFLILTVTSEDCYALRDGQNRAHKEFSFLNDSTGENHPLTNNTDTEFMCARKKKNFCGKPTLHSVIQNYSNLILNLSMG